MEAKSRPEWQERFVEGLRQEDPRLALIYDALTEDREQSVPKLLTRLLRRGYAWVYTGPPPARSEQRKVSIGLRQLQRIVNGDRSTGMRGLLHREADARAKANREPTRRAK